jgi:hypothetical protein
MIHYLALILSLGPSILLVAGACAVAVWAARLPDEQSSLVSRLTADKRGSRTTSQCGSKEPTKRKTKSGVSD